MTAAQSSSSSNRSAGTPCKIARGGMESLTPDELEFLKKASDRYRGD